MAFKIASAYVAVTPEDDGFEVGLRRIVDEAAAKVDANVGVGLRNEAPEELRADLDAALALVTEHLTADVGLGLKNDAVEELDADVKAGVELVQENNKVKVKVDPQAAKDSFGGLSPLLLGAFAAAATAGPGLVLGAVATAVVGAAALVQKNNAEVKDEAVKLAGDATDEIKQATAPLVPALVQSLDILDQGVEKVKPELRDLFAAAAPEATQMASGVTQLVENALPGLITGLRAAAPYSGMLATDFGKLGTGVDEFFTGLATGAQGGAIGLDALITDAEHLLGDVGQITGSLSNGLGPALHDVSDVVIPVADGLAKVVASFPPGEIRGAADAAVALFAAFKIASLSGLIAEGTTFVGFLKSAAAGEITLTGETGILATALDGLGTAADAAAGPLGLLAAGLLIAGTNSNSTSLALGGLKDHVFNAVPALDTLTKTFHDAANGSKDAQDSIDNIARTMERASLSGSNISAGIAEMDQALTDFYKTDPKGATQEYADVVNLLGYDTKQAAAAFPKYAQAAGLAAGASTDAAGATQDLSQALQDVLTPAQQFNQLITAQVQQLGTSAEQSGTNAVAALRYAGAQGTLNQELADAIGHYNLASDAASAFKSAEDALYGKYASYSQAEATFTEDLANATQQLTKGKNAIDLSTSAGAKNFTVLNQLAQANEQVAESFIKQGGSVEDATKKLQAGAQQIDDMARKAGFTDTQIAQLNKDLYGTANIKDIKVDIGADTSGVYNAVDTVIKWAGSQTAYVQVKPVGGAPGGRQLLTNADGGPVQAGDYSVVGERGPEIVQFGRAGTVIPHEAIRQVAGSASATGNSLPGIQNLNISIPITGIVDLTDPNSMSTAARRMVVNIVNAINQFQRGRQGARY